MLLRLPRFSSTQTEMLAHVHIMKTAGQTVCDILRQSLGADHCDLRAGELASVADVDFARKFYPNLRSIAGHSIRPWSELAEIPGLRFFTFLREPVARCLSHYQFDRTRNANEMEFLPWLESKANYQTRVLSGSQSAEKAVQILEQRVGFVGLVEDFDRSLSLLRSWSGYELNLHYRSRNVARSSSIKDQVLAHPENVEALQAYNTADMVVYEYVRTEVYPRMNELYSAAPCGARARTTIPMWWPIAKRGFLYKPAAQVRQLLRAS